MAEEEAAVLDALLELVIVVAFVDARVAVSLGLGEHVGLYVLQQLLHALHDALHGHGVLLQCVAAHYLERAVFKVASAHHQAYGHAFQLVVGELEARALVVRVVILHRYAGLAQGVDYGRQLLCYGLKLLRALGYGDYYHLYWREHRRQHQSVIV